MQKVEAELESLAAENVTDPVRIAQGGAPHRRQVGGETYRRQPMIVPTVLEISRCFAEQTQSRTK